MAGFTLKKEKTHGALGRHGDGVKTRFGSNDGLEQFVVDLVRLGGGQQVLVHRLVAGGSVQVGKALGHLELRLALLAGLQAQARILLGRQLGGRAFARRQVDLADVGALEIQLVTIVHLAGGEVRHALGVHIGPQVGVRGKVQK